MKKVSPSREEMDAEDGDEDDISQQSTQSSASGTGAESQSRQSESEESDDDASEEVLDSREKYLIFTMGSRTYTPHQIGNSYTLSSFCPPTIICF